MPIKKPRERQIDVAAVGKLRDALLAFAEEFDASDPEATEVALYAHISKLLTKGLIKTKKKKSDLRLDDVLANILKLHAESELLENARLFGSLISSYGGEPTERYGGGLRNTTRYN